MKKYPRIERSLALSLTCAVAFCLGSAAAADAQDNTLPPLHPTAIYSNYDGKSYAVDSVSSVVPEILYNGKLKLLPSGSGYSPQRAKAYADGVIQFKSQKATSKTISITVMFADDNATTPPDVKSAGSSYLAIVQADRTIPDCYLVLFVYNRNFSENSTTVPTAALVFQEIGTIPGGQDTKVVADFTSLDKKGGPYTFFPMIFSHGAEVRSNLFEHEAVFFRHLDVMVHDQLLAAYRQKFPMGDHPVVAAVRFAPIFPTPAIAASVPATVHISCVVTEKGLVDDVAIQEPLSPEATRAISRSVGGLMFFPRLVAGAPVSTPVQFPLNFGGPPPAAN